MTHRTEEKPVEEKVELPPRLAALEAFGRMKALASIMDHFKQENLDGISPAAAMWIAREALESINKYMALRDEADAIELAEELAEKTGDTQ